MRISVISVMSYRRDPGQAIVVTAVEVTAARAVLRGELKKMFLAGRYHKIHQIIHLDSMLLEHNLPQALTKLSNIENLVFEKL